MTTEITAPSGYDALLAAITPTSGPTKTILDPATGETVGQAPMHDLEYLEQAVAAAVAAQPAWAALGHDGPVCRPP